MTKFADICRVATTTTGTSDAVLGTTVPGYLSFSDAGVVDGDKVTYGIIDGTNREIGHGSYDATNGKLLRTTVLHSTNANAKISLSGAAQVYLTISQADIVAISAGAVTAGSATASVGSAATVIPSLTVDIDDASGWASGNPTRITIPAGQTRVRVTATGSASATCGIAIYKNGSLLRSDTGPVSATGNHLFSQVLTNWITVTPGDYFEVAAMNPNNTTISVACSLMVEYSPTGVLQGSGGGSSSVLTPPDPANFTWSNQSGMVATLHSTGSPPSMTVVSTSSATNNIALLLQTVSGSSWKITAKIRALFWGTSPSWMAGALVVYNSANSKLYNHLGLSDGLPRFWLNRWNSPTSQASNAVSGQYFSTEFQWQQIEYDGTNLIFKISLNGKAWMTVFTEAMSSFIGAVTHVGMGFANNCGAEAHWQIEHFHVGSDEGF